MDEQLKQRLIGATVIVAFAVIFVPMLFDEKSDGPAHTEVTEIPPMPKDLEEEPVELPRSVDEVATAESAEEGGQPERVIPITAEENEAAAESKPQHAADAKRNASQQQAKPTPTPVPEEESEEGYVEEDLPPATVTPAPKPTAKPVAPKKTPVPTPPPAESKTPAEKTAKAQPKAVPTEPPVRKPESPAAPEAGVGSWLVQAGSFVEETNAKALVEKLRQNKLSAYMETVHGSTGRVTYRVRIGPETDKAKADQALRQLQTVTGIRGYLVPPQSR